MSDEPRCRSVSPAAGENLAGLRCTLPRGHRRRWHTNPAASKRWRDGIRTPAAWEVKDDGHMSEADWQTWGRHL